MTAKKLTLRQKILVAGTLFGMFFGAGNLIFPVHLGQMAGQNALPAIIGFIINPLFLFFFAVLMLAALLAPGAAISAVEPVEAYRSDAFFPALIGGYGTMDAIAGLAFGIVVIDVIRRMGVDNDDAIAEDVLSSGLLTGALLYTFEDGGLSAQELADVLGLPPEKVAPVFAELTGNGYLEILEENGAFGLHLKG